MSVLLILGMSAAVGFISGLFGIGGGFLMTPLLIFLGVPPATAVATSSAQIAASSMTSVIGHWRRRAVDVKLGAVLVAGGLAGGGPRRPGLQRHPPRRPARAGHHALLSRPVRRHRVDDAVGEPQGDAEGEGGRPRAAPPRRASRLAEMAAADALPAFGALCQRGPARRPRGPDRLHRRAARHRRRLHHGPDAALSVPRACLGRGGHLALPDPGHHDGGDRAARGEQPVGGHRAGAAAHRRRRLRRAVRHARQPQRAGRELRLLLALLLLGVGARFAVEAIATPAEPFSITVQGGR